jgi:hypothetical protein
MCAGVFEEPFACVSTAGSSPDTPSSGCEYLFLLECVRFALGATGQQPVRVPELGISWARFLGLAERHQVLPLVRLALLETLHSVPDGVRIWLEERCRTLVAFNLSLSAELLELLASFRTSAIEATPFKGPALAMACYGNLAQRQISDLDLFVDKDQFTAAMDVMLSRGYVMEARARGSSQETLRKQYKDVLFTHPECGIHVDLHWSVAEPFFDSKLSSMAVPAGTWGVTLLGEAIAIHAPEPLLFLLCVHGLRHRWETLKWICDLAGLFAAHPAFDWKAALENARSVSRERTLLLGVALLRELTGFKVPAEVAQLIAEDRTLLVLCRQIYRGHDAEREVTPARSAEAVLEGAAFDALRLRSRESTPDRLGLFFRVMAERLRPTGGDKNWISLPKPAAFLYWVVRPVRILRQYGAACSAQLLRELLGALCTPSPPARDRFSRANDLHPLGE